MNNDLNADEDKAYMAPHVLAISATPIPRTLALALYGDMSLTQVRVPCILYFVICLMP
jgi:ATP-dependent DNA helicase RecG